MPKRISAPKHGVRLTIGVANGFAVQYENQLDMLSAEQAKALRLLMSETWRTFLAKERAIFSGGDDAAA